MNSNTPSRRSSMKTLKLILISLLGSCLLMPVISHANNFDTAVKNATAAIDKAKAANYEWRDSRKMLEEATKLNSEGKNESAMKLLEQVKKQGEMAVAQAEQQSSVNGPR